MVALLLASVGIYCLLAYMVGQRAHEIGVRMALGATRSTIGKMIVSRRPLDPQVFIAVPLILMVVVLLASYIPTRRAARVNPIVALRER